jgi:cyanate permease
MLLGFGEKGAKIAIGTGMAALGQNIGMFIGPILFGYLLDSTASWTATGYIMIPNP